MSRRTRFLPTEAGVVRLRLASAWRAGQVDLFLFAWGLSEQTGDPTHFDAFRGEGVTDANGRHWPFPDDPRIIRRAVDEQGLPIDQDGRYGPMPTVPIPSTAGVVPIQPDDRAELYGLDLYRASLARWVASRDDAELRPFATWTVFDRQTWRCHRLLTDPGALVDLIARGDLVIAAASLGQAERRGEATRRWTT